MTEKQNQNVRISLRSLILTAAIFAVIGAIGLLATIGKLISDTVTGGAAVDDVFEGRFMGLYTFLDLARFGSFGGFVLALAAAIHETVTAGNKKVFSYVCAGISVLGFVGCFLTSNSALYSAVKSAAMSSGSYWKYSGSLSARETQTQLMTKMFAPWIAGSILCLVAATAAVIGFFVTLSQTGVIKKPAPMPYGYPQGGQPAMPPQPPFGQPPQNVGMPFPQGAPPMPTAQQPLPPVQNIPAAPPMQQAAPAPFGGDWFCPGCGNPNSSASSFCLRCGRGRV